LVFPVASFLRAFPLKPCTLFYPLPCVPHAPPTSFASTWPAWWYLWMSTNYEVFKSKPEPKLPVLSSGVGWSYTDELIVTLPVLYTSRSVLQITILCPNVVVEWLTPLLRVREVPGSNLGLETDYPWYLQTNAGIKS
jgi:hypothetical protein